MNPTHLVRLALVSALLIPTVIAADDASLFELGTAPQKISGEYSFTEGPAVDRDGNVFFTDQPNDRIVRYGTDGALTDWLKPAGRSNGLYFDRDGNLLACADEKNELWSVSPDKKITVLLRDFEGKLLNGPNDLWITPAGDIYFTDPLYKRPYWQRDPAQQQPARAVYYFERKTGAVRVVDADFKQPNGIIGTPDGKKLYVADIGAGKTYVYAIAADGSLSERKLFCALGSDGMTLDERGNVYLTGKGVTVFNSDGAQIAHLAIPEPWTANVTFGGKERNQLFITASKAIYVMPMRVRGAR
jgi:gluconolactonase